MRIYSYTKFQYYYFSWKYVTVHNICCAGKIQKTHFSHFFNEKSWILNLEVSQNGVGLVLCSVYSTVHTILTSVLTHFGYVQIPKSWFFMKITWKSIFSYFPRTANLINYYIFPGEVIILKFSIRINSHKRLINSQPIFKKFAGFYCIWT